MIASLSGTVIERGNNYIVLNVGGVGYLVHVSLDALSHLSKSDGEVLLFIHLAVRENALELYGFLSREELDFFNLLIGISGIGPKSALAIFHVADVTTLKNAIAAGDSSYLTKVSGIGKKNAQKIILELRDKVGAREEHEALKLTEDIDALEALKALGYSTGEARRAMKQVPETTVGANERLKSALKILGQRP